MYAKFQVTLYAKMAMPDLQRYPGNLYLVTSLEDIVIFLGLKVLNSDNSYMFSSSRNAQVTFLE